MKPPLETQEELPKYIKAKMEKQQKMQKLFEEEKKKRGVFQYNLLSRQNVEPATESLQNATKFVDAVRYILSKNNLI